MTELQLKRAREKAKLDYDPSASIEERIDYVKNISHLFSKYSTLASFLGVTTESLKETLLAEGIDLYPKIKKPKRIAFTETKQKEIKKRVRPAGERDLILDFVKLEKSKGCVLCGYSRCLRALQFHHIDPARKVFEISKAHGGETLESVRDEISKCILVCSNCHAEIHDGIVNLNNEGEICISASPN